MELSINPKRIFRGLIAIVLVLYILGLSVLLIGNITGRTRLLGFRVLLNPGVEANIPTWFSTGLLLLAAALLAIIAHMEKSRGSRYSFQWRLLTLIFLYMSIDEAATLHENIATILGHIFERSAIKHYGWVIPGAGLAIAISMAFVRFVTALPSSIRRLVVLSGMIYIAGATVIEGFGRGWDLHHGLENIPYTFMVTTEELLEMTGVVVFIYALLSYIAIHTPKVTFYVGHSHKSKALFNADALPLEKLPDRNSSAIPHQKQPPSL